MWPKKMGRGEGKVGTNYMGILTGITKLQFSCIHNCMIFYLMDAKVAVEVPAYVLRETTH